MEAQEPLFRRGVPTLQTSLTSRELPHKTPPLRKQKFDSFFVVAGSCGEDFGLGGRIFPKVRLRARLVGGGVMLLSIAWDNFHPTIGFAHRTESPHGAVRKVHLTNEQNVIFPCMNRLARGKT